MMQGCVMTRARVSQCTWATWLQVHTKHPQQVSRREFLQILAHFHRSASTRSISTAAGAARRGAVPVSSRRCRVMSLPCSLQPPMPKVKKRGPPLPPPRRCVRYSAPSAGRAGRACQWAFHARHSPSSLCHLPFAQGNRGRKVSSLSLSLSETLSFTKSKRRSRTVEGQA